jgi:hypothetical protein
MWRITFGKEIIRQFIFAALIGLANILPSAVLAEQSQTSPSERYTDVFAFCRAVQNTPPDFTTDDRYVGQNPPRAVVRTMKEELVQWRCQNGEVYGCSTGASGRNCRHVTTVNTPTTRYESIVMTIQTRHLFQWSQMIPLRIGAAKGLHL